MLECIRRGGMAPARAKRTLEGIDGDVPFYAPVQFMQCIAALVALFPQEVGKLTTSGKPLRHLLWNASRPGRLQWMMNAIRFRHSAPKRMLTLLASGTTSNEALHAEINRWFDRSQAMHQATLVLKLHILKVGKLIAHNQALYRPASKQMDQGVVLARKLGSMRLWSTRTWHAWCKSMVQRRGLLQKAKPSLAVEVAAQRRLLKTYKRPASAILKRPASAPPLPPKAAKGVTKRTPFTLVRSARVVRWGK